MTSVNTVQEAFKRFSQHPQIFKAKFYIFGNTNYKVANTGITTIQALQ